MFPRGVTNGKPNEVSKNKIHFTRTLHRQFCQILIISSAALTELLLFNGKQLFSDTSAKEAKNFSQTAYKVYGKPCRHAMVYEKLN